MDNMGRNHCNTDKNNNERLLAPAKESKMRFTSALEEPSNTHSDTLSAGSSLKRLKNSINERKSVRYRSSVAKDEKGHCGKKNKNECNSRNEAEKERGRPVQSTSTTGSTTDKLSLLKYFLPLGRHFYQEEKKDSEKKDSEKKDSEKKDSEKKESEKKDSKKDSEKDSEKKDSEKKDSEKKDSEKNDSEKKDSEKREKEVNWNIGFSKEEIREKLLPETNSKDVMNKIIDAVTLENNLNSIYQRNLKTKSEKIESLFMDKEHKICNEVSVVCMYFTKETTCSCKQVGEAQKMTTEAKSEPSEMKRSSAVQVTSRGTVRERRELFRDNHGKDNSSSSESFTSRSFSKLHIISKAVCFPFNRPSDRSWCCVRSKKRKSRLRSIRVPKIRNAHSPCPSTSRGISSPSRVFTSPPRVFNSPSRGMPSTSRGVTYYPGPGGMTYTQGGYIPIYGRAFEGRQCGANTGESKGSGGTSPGQQDSGECQSGSMSSGGGGGGVRGGGGASGGGGGGQRGGGGSDERWWPPDHPDIQDADEKDGVPEKDLNDVDKGGESSIRNELNLNISGDASFGSSSGSSTKAMAGGMVGGRCASGELSDEDNNSAFLRQGPGAFLRKSPVFIDGHESHQTERKSSMDVHSRVAPGMVEIALALFDPSQNYPSHVIQEMKPLRHSMFTEINKCLRHGFDKDYLATAFRCGMCLSLSAMVRHMGRCPHSRSKCKACDHVSNILKMHVRRCMLLERQSTDNVPPGSDSGSIVTGFISSLLTSVPLACPVDFCVKLRKKLKSSRTGNHQAHLEMVWGKEDLWQRMKKMVAYLYDIDVDYEMDMPGEDMLDSLSLSLPVPSVAPSRMLKKTLIENFKKGLQKAKKKQKPEVPQKPKKVPPKIPPKPKFVPKKVVQEKQDVKEKLVLPEVERRAKTSPRRRLLGAVRDSDITDDLYGPGAAQTSDVGHDSSDMGLGAAGAFAAHVGAAEPSAPPLPQDVYMQPQYAPVPMLSSGEALVVPELVHFQAEMGADAVSAMGVAMAEDQVPGEGQVEYGTVEDLHLFVNRVAETKDRYESGFSVKNVHEGIILEHMQHCLSVIEGRYAEGEGLEWVSIVHLGSGVTGRCWLIMDGQTHFQACVKRVDLLKFDKREVEVWSSLYHRQVADLYGVIIHENEVLMFAEFIDGGTLAEVIAKYAEDRALYGEIDDVVKGIDVQNALLLYQQILTVLHYFMQPDVQILHEDIKADNVMIRAETSELVLVDFGLARHLPTSGNIPGGESPSGAQTHWSPEKAASEGHSFPADWWAATCVLLECITTKPPWLARYGHLKMLHFVIKMYSPPMDDVPANLDVVVRDLIKDAWTLDPSIRPPPLHQAKHPAFAKYGVPYMIEDDPDSSIIQRVEATKVTGPVPLPGADHVSSSGSSTVTSQHSQSLQSDPSPTPVPQMRRKKSDSAHSESVKGAAGNDSGNTNASLEASAGQESGEQTSEGVQPRLSVLLQGPSDASLDYTNTGARPKTYDQAVLPSAPAAPSVLQSKSVEEEQQELERELLVQNMQSEDPSFEKTQEIFEDHTSSKGDNDSVCSDLSLHADPPLPQGPIVGTLIEFRKTNSDHLCSVRVKDLKQRWKGIIETASKRLHGHFKEFTVFEDLQLTSPLRPDLAIGQGPTNRNVFVVDNFENWQWKCVKSEIEYNQETIPNGGIYFGM